MILQRSEKLHSVLSLKLGVHCAVQGRSQLVLESGHILASVGVVCRIVHGGSQGRLSVPKHPSDGLMNFWHVRNFGSPTQTLAQLKQNNDSIHQRQCLFPLCACPKWKTERLNAMATQFCNLFVCVLFSLWWVDCPSQTRSSPGRQPLWTFCCGQQWVSFLFPFTGVYCSSSSSPSSSSSSSSSDDLNI